MKLLNSMTSQVNVRIVEFEQTLELEITCFQDLRRTNERLMTRTYLSSNFVWYADTSSSGDINPMSYHLTAFELINQLLYLNFSSLERLLCCDFVTRSVLCQTAFFVLHSSEVVFSFLIKKVKAKSNRNRNCIFSFPWESLGSHIGGFLLCFTYSS